MILIVWSSNILYVRSGFSWQAVPEKPYEAPTWKLEEKTTSLFSPGGTFILIVQQLPQLSELAFNVSIEFCGQTSVFSPLTSIISEATIWIFVSAVQKPNSSTILPCSSL